MSILTIWNFKTSEGAEQTAKKLVGMQKQGSIEIDDAAIVSWPGGKKKPRTYKTVDLFRLDALDSAFWRLLFEVFFTASIWEGITVGALSGVLADHGVDDDFIGDVETKKSEVKIFGGKYDRSSQADHFSSAKARVWSLFCVRNFDDCSGSNCDRTPSIY